MSEETLQHVVDEYERDGVARTSILSVEEVGAHRTALEVGEAELGPVHYMNGVHTVMTSPWELATHPRVLDVVEALIGPDILIYNSTYIIKEPHSDAFVDWHQDLTYWGLADDDAQVSMWLALEPATVENGCMVMVPGSQLSGRAKHVEVESADNILLLGQRIEGVDSSSAQPCTLSAGEASFHHGWTVHTSAPNTTDGRRIGLNVQYLAPHNSQAADGATAILVRGEDRFNNFESDIPATTDFDPVAVAAWRAVDAAMKASFQTKT